MSTPKTVLVYSPEGVAVKATRLNAYDLVNGSGYSWKPGVETTPAAMPSYRTTKVVGDEPAQRVLNNAGHKTDRQASYESADEGEPEAEAEVEAPAAAEAEAEVLDEPPAAEPAPRANPAEDVVPVPTKKPVVRRARSAD